MGIGDWGLGVGGWGFGGCGARPERPNQTPHPPTPKKNIKKKK